MAYPGDFLLICGENDGFRTPNAGIYSTKNDYIPFKMTYPGAAITSITAAGHMPDGHDVFTTAGASVEFDTEDRSMFAMTWSMEAALGKRAVIAGTHGRITLEGGAAPTKLTVVMNPKPDFYPGAYKTVIV